MSTGKSAPDVQRPSRPRRPATWKIALAGAGAVLLLAIAAAFAWLASTDALQRAVALAVERSGGRLALDRVEGSLLGPVRIARLRWNDAGTSVDVEDIVLDYAPAMLLRGRLAIGEVTIAHVRVELADSGGEPIELPASLEPPIDVSIAHLTIDRVDWRSGETAGQLDQVELAYAADTQSHRIRDLSVDAPGVALRGALSVGSGRPYATQGEVTVALSAPHPEGRIVLDLGGDLQALQVDANGTLAGVAGVINAKLAPFADQPLVEGRVVARDIDLVRFDAAWPTTRLDVTLDARPVTGGFGGRLQLTNASPGPVDASRIPLAGVTSAYTLEGRRLELRDLRATLAGGATATGGGTLALDGIRSRWKLAVTNFDLQRVHTKLVATTLSGSVDADVSGDAQRIVAKLAQDDLALDFDARYDGKTLLVERASAQYAGGSLEGSGRFTASGQQAFALNATATRFDPARFGAFPSGLLDAKLSAKGTLDPQLNVDADLAFSPGSRLAGLPAQGRVRGRFTPVTVAGLDAALTLGANALRAQGAYGRTGDRIVVSLAGKRLAELAPLLPDDVPALRGVVNATVTFDARERGGRLSVDAHALDLAIGSEWRFAALDFTGNAVHDAPVERPDPNALRDITAQLTLREAVAPFGKLAAASAKLSGAPAAHVLSFAVSEGKQRLEGRVAGAVTGLDGPLDWRGRVEALAARGVPGVDKVALLAPVEARLSADTITLGAFGLQGGGTVLESEVLVWREGALETRGSFRGLPVALLMEFADVNLRGPMDIAVGGRWDISSKPAWRGTLSVARERGDIHLEDPIDAEAKRIALGIEVLKLDAKLDGNRLTGNAELHARLGGNAIAEFALDAPAGAAHPFTPATAVKATLRAHIPALATLQPWIGTAARVRGQAIGDVAVQGTLERPVFTGQVVGYGLNVDMPQHGMSFSDGRFRLVSGSEGLRLEELVFKAGDGTFTASGVLGLPRQGGGPRMPSRIDWRAESFRLLNRPDRRLVVDGEGTLAYEAERLVVRGKLAAVQGNIEYRTTAATSLASDIVVVGRPRPGQVRDETGGSDIPVDLDLALELGRDLQFSGEGIDTRLGGRIQITSKGGAPILAKGTIYAVRGTYEAFGQRLAIERGRIIFDGPVDNPAIDVVALRKNLAVEAGVEISGTVRAPVVRLTSNPPVPDSEKLSWLLTGGPSGSGSARDSAALAAASAALAGRGGKTIPQQLAQSFGLDDISLAQRDTTSDNFMDSQVVSLGKRLSDRLYIAYEQGLALANNAVRLEYVLSRYFTVSAFAGTSSGLALTFRRSWR